MRVGGIGEGDFVPFQRERCPADATAHDWMVAVSRSVRCMRENIGDTHSLPSLARSAPLSPFHFHRVFRQLTASTPARFLAALRMAEAKRLLATTSISVTDICMQVGYSSLGTFSTQFTRLVGISPRRFRRLIEPVTDQSFDTVLTAVQVALAIPTTAQVTSAITGGPASGALALVGLFPSGIPQEQPVACSVVSVPSIASFGNLNDGDYHMLAISFSPSATVLDTLLGEDNTACFVGASPATVRIRGGRSTSVAPLRIELRMRRQIDPPLVLALPLLLAAEVARIDPIRTRD
ncbi:MAG: helix-turn-helix transcriptional regulator [Pseudonocardiaceae bacterium]